MPHRARTSMVKVSISVTAVVAAVALVATSAYAMRDQLGFGSQAGAVLPQEHGAGAHRAAIPAAVTKQQAQAAGPLTDLDKELLVRVRQANLWELPAGALAQTNGGSEQVKRAGQHLLDGHSRLDQIVREMAAALDVEIPDEPTEEQQGWIEQLEDSKGEEFDRFFANVLRSAHGKVFVIVAQVRSTTKNSLIRDLAIEANIAVSDHLQVLEDTGLVEAKTLDDVAKSLEK